MSILVTLLIIWFVLALIALPLVLALFATSPRDDW